MIVEENDLCLILPLALGIPILLIAISSMVAYKYWFRIVYKYYTFVNRQNKQRGLSGTNYQCGFNLIYSDEEAKEAGRFVESLERVNSEMAEQHEGNNIPLPDAAQIPRGDEDIQIM